ncbi:hypothetical protein NHH03_17745 [Stieleria sp. TO1_6]|uniref:hypothetical protein n=1 Tax=Stieleria tagensis TaxID=2956795 RepID=UPI00209BA4B2|nr:hypothetical protein [Stieleria tagensis]MCO8123593.1 hypothetical protein [Stieleria tagensis]
MKIQSQWWTCGIAASTFLFASALAIADEPLVPDDKGQVVDIRGGVVDEALSAERLKTMLTQSRVYDVKTTGQSERHLTLDDRPLMRFNNPVSGVPDGIIAMWKDGPRPAVVAQVFQLANGTWLHEAQSLAPAPLSMRNTKTGDIPWQPTAESLRWKSIKDVVVDSRSAASRLRQMRRIASEFSAVDHFQVRSGDTARSPYKLRLLPQPVYRYSDPEKDVVDGAMFAFVHGTDPEMFLVLEATEQNGQTSWRYSIAPMTCWAIDVHYNDQPVWNIEERLGKSTPADNYHVWGYHGLDQ